MKRILRTVTNEKNPAHYYNAEGPNTGLKAQKILRTFITVKRILRTVINRQKILRALRNFAGL